MTKFQKLQTTLKVRAELKKMPNEVVLLMYNEMKKYLSEHNILKDL